MNFKSVKLTKKNVLQFVIPALIGVFIFLCPMSIGERKGMLVGIILTAVGDLLISWTPTIVVYLMALTTLLSIVSLIFKPKFIMNNDLLKSIFIPNTLELCIRIGGCILGFIARYQLLSEVIYSGDTGGTALELVANIMVWFIVASFFVPFLLDFGLMEFIGTMTSKIARPLLKIPGRSMIDVLTSFVGDQNLGIMITNDQYVNGHYTGKEAAIISTCFSATGLAYWYVISSILHVEMHFIPIVITMFVTNLICTMIMCRIPPLSNVDDAYYQGQECASEDIIPEGLTTFQYAVQLAVQQAQKFQGIKSMAKRSVRFSLQIVCSVLPVVMLIGTVGLIIATYTPVFDWIGLPFKYYMQLLQIPEAAAAAPATVAGFADMLIPSLLCAELASAKTRFIICVLSLSQIIYMSEVGPILLMSKIPVKFGKLVTTFLVKTIIAIPIIAVMATIFGIPV